VKLNARDAVGHKHRNARHCAHLKNKETSMCRQVETTKLNSTSWFKSWAFTLLALALLTGTSPSARRSDTSASLRSAVTLDSDAVALLDPPGSVDTRAYAITSAGDVVGQYFTADQRSRGFLLTRSIYTIIDPPGSVRTTAAGISCLWRERNDSDLDVQGHPAAHDDDRDRRGCSELAVVGRFDTADAKAHGFVLSGGTVTTIDFPGATFTIATSVNAFGEIVGRYRSPDGVFHGFSLIDGTFTTIDYPGAFSIQAMAINDLSHVAGYYQDAGLRYHGFVFIDGSFTTFDPLDSINTGAAGSLIGFNSHGEIAGRYTTADGRTHGFLLKDGEYTQVDIGDRFTCNNGINDEGDIVGLFEDANGQRHGFVTSERAVRKQLGS
jgi:probable HAF family extracellular repeat protein